jgi:hypothetical protein
MKTHKFGNNDKHLVFISKNLVFFSKVLVSNN